MKTEAEKQLDFFTELYEKIEWMEGCLEDLKFIAEILEEADKLLGSNALTSNDAGDYAKTALKFVDLDEIDNTLLNEIVTTMDGIANGEGFAPDS